MLWRSLGSGPTISMRETAINSGIWWRAMSASPFTIVSPTPYTAAELSSGIYRLGDGFVSTRTPTWAAMVHPDSCPSRLTTSFNP